ncbi:hypothetical protein Rcae01_03960 [Novipirellula caenicola]|uniref:Uncharacterized protein n=1 Tax=Novipirellula caenicola TaxID=1536901 RepID=A0ABP9VTM2_9BACT
MFEPVGGRVVLISGQRIEICQSIRRSGVVANRGVSRVRNEYRRISTRVGRAQGQNSPASRFSHASLTSPPCSRWIGR